MPSPEPIPAQPQDAFNDYARIVADQQLGIVLEFADHLEPERLARAALELIEAQPVLGCRFVSAGRHAWHEAADGAGAIATAEDADPWPRAVFEAGQPLGPSAPHLALTLVRGPRADALAIRIDHTAADGQGTKACAELLAAAYGGSLAQDRRSFATDRSWARLRRSAGWPRLLRAARARTDPRPTWGFPGCGEATGRRHHDLVTLSEERFSAVRAWGRAHNYTVNDVVLGAFYRAMFGLLAPLEGAPMVVRVSFDQRRYLVGDEDPMPAASNLSSLEPIAVARIAGERFAGTVARVAREMQRLKASYPGLGSALLLETLYRLRGYAGTGRGVMEAMRRGQKAGVSYPFVSNFGVLNAENLRFGATEPTHAVMLPVAAHPPFGMLGVSSFGGELTLSFGFAEGEIAAGIARSLLEAMVEDLPA